MRGKCLKVAAPCHPPVASPRMADVEQFWIANSLYLAFVLAAITSAVVKIVAYRRGL